MRSRRSQPIPIIVLILLIACWVVFEPYSLASELAVRKRLSWKQLVSSRHYVLFIVQIIPDLWMAYLLAIGLWQTAIIPFSVRIIIATVDYVVDAHYSRKQRAEKWRERRAHRARSSAAHL